MDSTLQFFLELHQMHLFSGAKNLGNRDPLLSCTCLFFPLPWVFLLDSTEPPRFIRKLEPARIVKQGESTRYECKIGGSPEIKVLWYKDETEIQESSKFRMSFVDSVAVLEMHGLGVEDSGDYTCEARNAAGSASSSTSLKVKGETVLCLPTSSPVILSRTLH